MDVHIPAVGDRYRLRPGRYVRVKHVGFGVALCDFCDSSGHIDWTPKDERDVSFRIDFLTGRCTRVRRAPAETSSQPA